MEERRGRMVDGERTSMGEGEGEGEGIVPSSDHETPPAQPPYSRLSSNSTTGYR